jgi:hypothetical protein
VEEEMVVVLMPAATATATAVPKDDGTTGET